MENLYINISTRAIKDSPGECGNTLTIGNLIDLLSGYDEDTPIYLKLDNGASYSPIHFSDMVSNEDKPNLFMLMLLDDFNVTYTALYARDAGDTSVHMQDDIEAYNKLNKIIKDGLYIRLF
jgi:hypothetical protein